MALHPAWCSIDVLCRTVLPPYFVLILPTTLLLIVRILSQRKLAAPSGFDASPDERPTLNEVVRRQVSPSTASRVLKSAAAVGYLLAVFAALTSREFSPWAYLAFIAAYLAGQVLEGARPRQAILLIRDNASMIMLIVSSHLSLIFFLAWNQRGSPARWAAGAIFIACMIGLIRFRRRRSPIVWIVLAALVNFSSRIDSWQLAIVGDEYRFFFDARAIITPLRLNNVISHLFDGTWTYGTHPYISSLIQAIFMFFLGRDNFGWRFSNIFLSALSIGFFYLFFRSFFSRRVSLLTALLLASSHYLMNFSKIGYNNLQALFVMGLVLWLAGIAARSARPIAYTALGVASSACFYVFPGALYVLPLPVLLVWLYTPHKGAEARRQAGLALGAFIILVFPLIVQPEYWESKLAGVFLHSRDLVNSSTSLWFHFGSNLLYSLFSYLYTASESHFVVSSYVDPLTAVFVPIGFALALREARRSKSALFLVLAFLLEVILVGTTHDRPFPTSTRMFLMLPWFFLLAALGIDHGLDLLAGWISNPLALPTVAGVLTVAILGLNIYQATHVFRKRTIGTPGLETLFLRMLQHDAQEDPKTSKDYLFLTAPDWGIDGLLLMQDVYKLPPSPTQLQRIVVETPELPQHALSLISRPETVVILQPWMDETTRHAIEVRLAGLGMKPCPVRDVPRKDIRFTFWFTPGMEALCERANADW